jgi:diguanylate cyclase (GGDEF)-like protein
VLALGIFTLLVEVFIIRSILQNQVAIPLSRLIRATHVLGLSGERMDSDDLPIQSQNEIGELARDFFSMAKRIQDSQQQLENKVQERTVALAESNLKLRRLSMTDGLTDIANRRHFDDTLENEWKRAARSGQPLALAMLDIDWFKKYNDHYGHQAGDECLRLVAATLASSVSRTGDLVARYGGEEFVFIAPATNCQDAQALAQKVCEALHAQALPHELSAFGCVTVSIGVAAMIPEEHAAANILVKAADEALYRAKEEGRNRVVLAS